MARVTLRFEACEPGQASLFPSSPLMMPAIFEPAAAWSLLCGASSREVRESPRTQCGLTLPYTRRSVPSPAHFGEEEAEAQRSHDPPKVTPPWGQSPSARLQSSGSQRLHQGCGWRGKAASPQTDPRGWQSAEAFSPAPPTLPAENRTTLRATRKGAGQACPEADTHDVSVG